MSPIKKSLIRTLLFSGIGLTGLYTFLLIIVISLLHKEIRDQIISRDADLLSAVAANLLEREDDEFSDSNDFVNIAIDASELGGVIGVEVHDLRTGIRTQIPENLNDAPFTRYSGIHLFDRQSSAYFHPGIDLNRLFPISGPIMPGEDNQPMVEVNIPLFDEFQLPIARIRYWLDGSTVAAEYRQLNNRLWLMGFIAWTGFVFLLAIVLVLSGRYLWRQSIELQKANAELSLSARASALGSISAHLIHGVKNSLAFLIHHLQKQPEASEAHAVALEMKSFIDDAVATLRMEEDFKSKINFTLQEVCEIAADRHKDLTNSQNVKIQSEGTSTREITSREASLILLILSNLIHNAMEVSPPGSHIHLNHHDRDDASAVIEITDHGSGIPLPLQQKLFQPGTSGKANGSGLGLAISAQIARSINAQITLKETSNKGTTFQLTLLP